MLEKFIDRDIRLGRTDTSVTDALLWRLNTGTDF